MKVLLALCLATICARSTQAQGAGRAIPIATENFIIDLFRSINPRIDYDTTNFLVDLSGHHANCRHIGSRQHRRLTRMSSNQETIGLVQDYTIGDETHTVAVDNYLRPVFEGWVRANRVSGAYGQIRDATKFGCSVRPGCRGSLSVACLFSPYSGADRPSPPPVASTTTTSTTSTTTTTYTGVQRAVAFTPEQYIEAEFSTGQNWDKSYFLENLSGYETRCEMIDKASHDFDYAQKEAGARGRNVVGLYGSAPNFDSTPNALREILANMKEEALASPIQELKDFFLDEVDASRVKNAKQVGCSLIADCFDRSGQMTVVVSCIFELSSSP